MIFIRICIATLLFFSISACQLLPEDAQLRSYRVLVQQGNVIEESKIDALKINMTKEQVVFLLGEPVLNNIFDKNRWDYVYYRKREPEATKLNMISIFFKDENVVSMKRIVKNDDGLFEISGKNSNEEPKFLEEIETASLKQEVFEDIELKGTNDEDINIEGFEEDKNNEKIEENKKISKVDEGLKKENTETLKEVNEIIRKNDYEVVSEIINDWAQAWQRKDLNAYFGFYIDEYSSEYFDDHLLWKKDRTNRISGKNKIQIEISELSLEFKIDENELAVSKFTQKYMSDNYSDKVIKELSLKKINKNWKIISEKVIKSNY